jgi:UDP-glucose 4-epimerase
MSTILVTGGAGYIGSHMLPALRRQGYRPLVLDNLIEGHRAAAGDAELAIGSLADFGALRALIRANRPLAIFHFAAACSVAESVADPLKYYETNLVGTYNLLRAALESGVPRLIFSSTAAVYGEPESVPITEDHPTRPINPYGRTKLAAENMLRDYAEAYGVQYVSFRYFNAAGADPVAGLGEDHRPESHLIPLALRAIEEADAELQVFGNDYPTTDGTCVRDFVHVRDIVSAHLLGLEYLLDGGANTVFNLGSETGHTVMQVLERVEKVTGHEVPHVIAPRRAGDPASLVASSLKAREVLGWNAEHDLDSMIASAWDWRRTHPRGYGEESPEPPPGALLY